MKRGQKAGFFAPDIFDNHTSKGKRKGEKKERDREEEQRKRREKKAMVTLLVIILATLEKKKTLKRKLLDGRGLIGDNVHKSG